MRKLFVFIISCSLSLVLIAQNGKKFNFQKMQFGSYLVTSSDRTKAEGQMGTLYIKDQKYVDTLISKIMRNAIPDEKSRNLLGSGFTLYISRNGNVIDCVFTIKEKVIDLLTEDELYTLYKGFKKLVFDTDKFAIVGGGYVPDSTSFDYTIMVGLLKFPEYRKF